jgi:hypothetical protein
MGAGFPLSARGLGASQACQGRSQVKKWPLELIEKIFGSPPGGIEVFVSKAYTQEGERHSRVVKLGQATIIKLNVWGLRH